MVEFGSHTIRPSVNRPSYLDDQLVIKLTYCCSASTLPDCHFTIPAQKLQSTPQSQQPSLPHWYHTFVEMSAIVETVTNFGVLNVNDGSKSLISVLKPGYLPGVLCKTKQ